MNIRISIFFSVDVVDIYRPPHTDDGKYFCDILQDNILSKFQSSHNIMLCDLCNLYHTNINLCDNKPFIFT